MIAFVKYYLKSMRLYYCFVTLTAAYAGMVWAPDVIGWGHKLFFGAIFFCCWGVNQIVNDFLNLEEDRINAPNRPMVSGKLPAKPALAVSAVILLGIGVSAVIFNPVSLIPALIGIFMNVIYAYAKAWGILANVAFGLTIACCPWFGYTLAGGGLIDFFVCYWKIWLVVVILNMVMTYFTYFKDCDGDRAANQRTLIVRLGPERAALLGLMICLIPALLFWVFPGSYCFAVTSWIGSVLFMVTGYLFYRSCRGPGTYFNLKYNFSALCASQCALVTLAEPLAGLVLCLISVSAIFIIMQFGYNDATE